VSGLSPACLRAPMTYMAVHWKGSWARLARRRTWLIRASTVMVVLAVLVSGLAGALRNWLVGRASVYRRRDRGRGCAGRVAGREDSLRG
jgi:hypothetical protein